MPGEDALTIGCHVPVEIAGGSLRQTLGEGRLPHLPRASDEDHLAAQVVENLRSQISGDDGHRQMLRQI